MKLSDFDFDFPPDLIAHHPLPRGESRLLVLSRRRTAEPLRFLQTRDFPAQVEAGDVVVLNDTRVLPARLFGRSEAGGRVEILLLKPAAGGAWEALVKPGKRCSPGKRLFFSPPGEGAARQPGDVSVEGSGEVPGEERGEVPVEGAVEGKPELQAEVLEVLEDGTRLLRFELDAEAFLAALSRFGTLPLPPYIRRAATSEDAETYQSAFARVPGSVAAPTASLHFSADHLAEIQARGARIAYVTLHVGAGTFKPVQSEEVEGHRMHAEWFSLPPETAAAVNRARAEGRRIFAVGTTVARVLESCAVPAESGPAGREGGSAPDEAQGESPQGPEDARSPWGPGPGRYALRAREGETEIFIRPGYEWKAVDALFTNFHWPKSTLFMLVSSLLGTERARATYAEAIARRFRLFSYGDAMLILP